MKPRIMVALSLLVVVLALANLLPSHAQKASETPQVNAPPPLSNPLKVALLKWYPANTTTSFPTGTDPFGLAFDGSNIWVANNVSSTVQKFRANDGALLGTFNINFPAGICFDGSNIWVTSYPFAGAANPSSKNAVAYNTITKLRASDGKVLGTFNTGRAPFWPTFDGANVWVPNAQDNNIMKFRASDGALLGTFNVGVSPDGTAFDGSNIWVTNYTGSGPGSVTKIRASDGTVLGTFTVGYGPIGIAFDGANMWVANNNGGTVNKLRASDGTTLGTFNLGGEAPYGVGFDGANIWVTGAEALIEMRASDGKELLALPQPGNASTGIAFDGANIWVAYSNGATLGKL